MISEISLTNFKSFESTGPIPIRPLTLIYGPNSAGKSSIIQSLMLLKQSIEGHSDRFPGLVPRGSLVDLGSYRSLVHGHDRRNRVEFVITTGDVATRNRSRFHLDFGWVKSSTGRYDAADLARYRFSTDDLPGVNIDLQRDQRATARARQSSTSITLQKRIFRWTDENAWLGLAERFSGASESNTSRRLRIEKQEKLIDEIFSTKLELAPVLVQLKKLEPLAERAGDDLTIIQSLISEAEETLRRGPTHMTDSQSFLDRLRQDTEDAKAQTFAELAALLDGSKIDAFNLLPSHLRPKNQHQARHNEKLVSQIMEVLEVSASHFYQLFGNMSYLGPLRSHPSRLYVTSGIDRLDVGITGEYAPELLFMRSEDITGIVNRWFRQLEIPYEIAVDPVGDAVTGQAISVRLSDRNGLVVAPTDVGFGIGQLLPIIIQGVVSAKRGATVCVEQPEIHLHPRLQAHVGDFLAATAGVLGGDPDVTNSARWIVETHSEAIALRLRRRVREGKISPEDLCFLYVDLDENGNSSVSRLRLDDNGDFIDEWPGGFFEEGFHELFPEVLT